MKMNKHRYGLVIIAGLTILAAFIQLYTLNQQELDLERDLKQLNHTEIQYNTTESIGNVSVYVMDNEELRRKGLMNLTSLEKDGMVFVYEEADSRSFWMKNTYIPIYIYFLDEDGVTMNREFAEVPEQPENVEGGGQHTYSSSGEAKYVIELKKEVVERKEIGEETVFDVSQFR